MKKNELDDVAFAKMVKATRRAVSKWKYGETRPRIPELVRIEQMTNGEVRPVDFLTEGTTSPAPAPETQATA